MIIWVLVRFMFGPPIHTSDSSSSIRHDLSAYLLFASFSLCAIFEHKWRRIVYEAEADDENRNDAKWSRIDPIQFQRLKKEKKKSECKQSENSFFTAFICYI